MCLVAPDLVAAPNGGSDRLGQRLYADGAAGSDRLQPSLTARRAITPQQGRRIDAAAMTSAPTPRTAAR